MPELPEIESIRRYLVSRGVEGKRIERVEIGWPDSVSAPSHDIEAFANGVYSKQIEPLHRRGKYLVSPLTNGRDTTSHLVLHMGMTGSLHVRNSNEAPVRYRRAAFYLNDGRRIELNDFPPLGSDVVCRRRNRGISEAGTGALGHGARGIRGKASVEAITHQTDAARPELIAGVGNIYADESLHRSGISPLRRCNRISVARLVDLHASIIAVLEHAIEFISTHPSEDGSPYVVDAYDERMRVQRSPNSACPDCGNPVSSRRIAGRTAYYCRACQH